MQQQARSGLTCGELPWVCCAAWRHCGSLSHWLGRSIDRPMYAQTDFSMPRSTSDGLAAAWLQGKDLRAANGLAPLTLLFRFDVCRPSIASIFVQLQADDVYQAHL